MRKEKGFISILLIGLILIIIIVVAAVAFIMGKGNQNPVTTVKTPAANIITTTTTWKTYTSKSGNTTIQYPSDWAYREFDSGVAFYNIAVGDVVGGEPITIGEFNKTLNDVDLPFADYVKVAAMHEIQNYQSLSSINQVTTASGIIGYTTTWGDSLPITYFPIPNVKTSDIQISLGDSKFLSIYQQMLKTLNIKATASTPATSNLNTYTNSQYHFEIKFPNNYKALTDSSNLYGWPNAVALIYKGGQSYDLPIEVWNTEADYQIKYPDPSLTLVVHKTNDGKFITFTNVNKDPEVDQIISTFKFIQ